MDDNKNLNQPNNATPNNDDYQKILDEYAASIKPEENSPEDSNSEEMVKLENVKEDLVEENTEEKLSLKSINSLQIEAPDNKSISANTSKTEPSLNTQPLNIEPPIVDQSPKITETKPNIEAPIAPQPTATLPPEPASTETKTPEEIKAQIDKILADDSSSTSNSPSVSSNAKSGAKVFFFLSIAIFFLVAASWIYFLYFYQQPTTKNTNTNAISPTPTEVIKKETCELNGVTYEVGESFKSADGCNTCSCQTSNTIACTEMACNISPAITSPATKSATKTPTKVTLTPTKSATTSSIPKDWKTYTNPSYSYSFQYPSNWSVKQSSSGVTGESETVKNMSINLIDTKNTIIMNISTDTVAKNGNISLEKFATQITPLDKVSISQVTYYKIGSLEGIKEMVNFEEEIPGIQSGFRYFTKSNKYFVTFATAEKQTSSNITNILSTFKFN